MLRSIEYDVQEAEHGHEALRCFEQERFDLVLTDIQMPYMDGWELTRRVKTLVPGMRVIAMTGMSPWEVPVTSEKIGPDYVIFKPLKMDELKNAMAIAFVPHQLEIAEENAMDLNCIRPRM
jgi:CheY-like chemotaxis protein